MAATSYSPHFSKPWKFSDVVLVVENQKFHVHRSTLAFWSPVFERMFTTDFKEKDNDEISLRGKIASNFEEMLQMMYPSLEEKLITQRNCYFLFELAHEYQIDSVAQKSINLMVSMVEDRTEDDVLSMLVYAQKYELKSLISTCIYEARRLTLQQLKGHGKRGQIEPDNYVKITERIIDRLEEQRRRRSMRKGWFRDRLQKTMAASTSYPSHFSEPWKFSDVVLVVEDQRFHVHRSTLAFWSPVFERMFATDFKEKYITDILLPGKKANEFEEMLQIMYPSLEEKLITQRNCYFLFELAHEYQIDSIVQKCVNLMISMVKNRKEYDVLGMLVYAQKYEIKSLISTCIYEARRLNLRELKEHGKRDQIERDNYVQITEGIIDRLEGQRLESPFSWYLGT
ncbi:BTB and MATH domain-containing protein 45-like isoform X2 [Montipora foliosa]|uniref:BTB and MATH domain-containing protein 45-like isoform X2 n=1 Tax=Montipora foliosa TaxID=591990 RepID=UPI0035F14CE9